jgi:hypothetical protein
VIGRWWLLTLALAGAQPLPPVPTADMTQIVPVPDAIRSEFGITSSWYVKYLDADGIPILGSAHVSDAALWRARRGPHQHHRIAPPSVAAHLRSRRNRIVILGLGETVRDIPEFAAAFPDRSQDERYWAGFGATETLPITSGTEENLLRGLHRENVFIHEFGHTVAEQALALLDPEFTPELSAAYAHAQRTGLWRNTYADDSQIEYWAEGVQTWFNVNRDGPIDGDGVHNDINTRVELELYDAPLFRLLSRIYSTDR